MHAVEPFPGYTEYKTQQFTEAFPKLLPRRRSW